MSAATMRAAWSEAPGRIELRERSRPTPGAGEVVVRVRACGVCGSDLHWFQGGFPPPPVCPGHEIAGEVENVGAQVAAVRAGDRVAVEPLVTCGVCARCRGGEYQRCAQLQLLGTHRDGGLADFTVVPARAVFALPGELDFAVGALSEPTAVCVHALRLAQTRLGDRVLVLGAGTIGQLCVLVARMGGASEIAITARHPQQAAMARQLGATRVFDTSAEGERARRDAARAQPFDVVVETVGGSAATIDDGIQAVRPGGAVVVLGIFTGRPTCNASALVGKEVRLLGSMTYGRAGARADFDVAIDILRTHTDLARQLVTHRFELGAVQAAFEMAADKRSGAIKVTVLP